MPFGLFKFLLKPFGQRNATQTFQRFIDQLLRGLHFCYMDIYDIVITSATTEEQQEYLCLLSNCLQDFIIVINRTKCIFGVPELNFLNQCVNRSGIRPLKENVQSI